MNEVIANIYNRKSCRSFLNKNISENDLKAIVCAGVKAPSAMNMQTWHFTVLQDKFLISKLAKTIGKVLNREGYDFYKPDALIITSNEKSNKNGDLDCACALQNMFLAAESLGIGSVWINQLKGICDNAEIRKVLNELKVPKTHDVYGMAAIGYPASKNYPKDKNETVIDYIL